MTTTTRRRNNTKVKSVPFHKIALKSEFKSGGTTFLRITPREGVSTTGQVRKFRDSELVTPV